MAIQTCEPHGVLATKRCPVCHRALCSRCKTRDGCCSAACYGRRQKYGLHAPVPPTHGREGGGGLFVLLLKLAALAGLAYAGARYFGKI